MSRISEAPLQRYAGFSLVEIMVGVVIGMLAIIVIMQVFAMSEGQKRTTVGGADAQNSGAIMLHALQRDIGQAGYGFASRELFGCALTWKLPSGTDIATPVPLAPVAINPAANIIPAGDANTDTMLVIYGNAVDEPQGNAINASAANVHTVQMPNSFKAGDRVIAAPAACTAGALVLDRISSTSATTVTAVTSAAGTTLFNLGQRPQILAYAVRNGNLTVCDYLVNDCGLDASKNNASIWVAIAGQIVSMKAEYGRDSTSPTMDAILDTYDRTTPVNACGWSRVSALRLALVARSAQFETRIDSTTGQRTCDPVTPNAPAWNGSAGSPIDLSAYADWQCHRYKVSQTVVPIRNVAWMGVQPGC